MAREVSDKHEGEKRALIIGISRYDKLTALDFCEKDGNMMYEVLSKLGYNIPDKLTGGRVDYVQLRDSIYDFFGNSNIHPKDTILFYFSGHGVLGDDGEHYLATSEIDPDKPHRRGFSFDELSRARENCNSKTIFTILDCCYSGGDTPDAKGEDESADAAKQLIKNKSKALGEGKCILTACKPMQKAYQYREKGHSFFTFYLAEALSKPECTDEDGDITPELVNRYIDYTIRSLPENIRPKQTPLLDCRTAGKIILAHHPKEITKIEVVEEKKKETESSQLLTLLLEGNIQEFNKLRNKLDIPLYFRRADLSGKNLIGVDLHEADLTKAKLINAKLKSANLMGTRLSGADLSGADLRSVDLFGANLTEANLSGADLRGADLKGMIDFTGANLTGAHLRGADLKGMVNFENAVLHDVDFTGAFIDIKLINLKGVDTSNVKGLPILYESNEYLEALKSFSESINQQFKTHNISPEQRKPIEENIKELVEKVEDIKEPQKINWEQKRGLKQKITDNAIAVIQPFPKSVEEIQRAFTPLSPFSTLIGHDVQELVKEAINKDSMRKQDDAKARINKRTSLDKLGKHDEVNIKYIEKNIKTINTSTPDKNEKGWYNWEIYLDASDDILKKIKHVKYILHPTFPQREIVVDRREDHFKMNGKAWGEFVMRIEIILEAGETIIKNHLLKLGGATFPGTISNI